jgi:8-oxo-dGTP diphosphatase
MKILHKIGLAIVRDDKLLMVRDKENGLLIFPGGVVEGNETDEECLEREIQEELGVKIKKDTLKYVGKFSGPAYGKKDTELEFDMYAGEVEGELKPQGEIVSLHWFDKRTDWDKVTEIGRYKLIPGLIQKNILK